MNHKIESELLTRFPAKETLTLDLNRMVTIASINPPTEAYGICNRTKKWVALYHKLASPSPSLKYPTFHSKTLRKISRSILIIFYLELKLSNNRVSSLPTEMTNCTQLEHVDISSNSFVTLPPVLGQIPSLKTILARKNYLADVDVEIILGASNLETIDLEENPLSKKTYDELSQLSGSDTRVRILLSPRTQEDWEDLSI